VIDLHCHILPALDDGALDLDDSLEMARQAQEDGIAVVCATPHIRHDHKVRVEEIAERVHSLQVHPIASAQVIEKSSSSSWRPAAHDELLHEAPHVIARAGIKTRGRLIQEQHPPE
jgi:pyruvate-formate lyase-activating enzyme